MDVYEQKRAHALELANRRRTSGKLSARAADGSPRIATPRLGVRWRESVGRIVVAALLDMP